MSSLCGHRARVVRPERCRWLNYEGEVAIVIGRHCRNVARDEAGELAEQADLRSAPYFLGNGAGRFGIASPVACP